VFTARYGLDVYIQFYVLFHTVNLCVLYGSENKQRLFPYTALRTNTVLHLKYSFVWSWNLDTAERRPELIGRF